MGKKKALSAADKKKKAVIRRLSESLKGAGIEVRREELKRGPGWSATSGACLAEGKHLVFLDRRSELDEQISFLCEKISSLELQDEVLAHCEEDPLPASVVALLKRDVSESEAA